MSFSVPLILKVIKWSHKLGMRVDRLTQFMSDNMKRFQVVLDRSKIPKGAFYGILFAKARNINP